MPGRARPTTGDKEGRQRRLRALTEDYVKGGYKTYTELAARYGVNINTICQDMKVVRAYVEEHFVENAKGDFDRRMLQLETMIEEGFRNHELTKRKKTYCKRCKGAGEIEKGETTRTCEKCNGEGFWWEKRAGDSKHLKTALEALQEICKLKGHHPEKTKHIVKEARKVTLTINGADAKAIEESRVLMLKARKRLFQIEQSGETLEAEFGEPEREKDE